MTLKRAPCKLCLGGDFRLYLIVNLPRHKNPALSLPETERRTRGTRERLLRAGGARQVSFRGALHAVPAIRFRAIECDIGCSQELLPTLDRAASRIPRH